jgi:hypothetical protein
MSRLYRRDPGKLTNLFKKKPIDTATIVLWTLEKSILECERVRYVGAFGSFLIMTYFSCYSLICVSKSRLNFLLTFV